ncbi:hypothetical protein EG344_00755 [Chryseobacterium sp. G0162]|uniref:hypothetical protein n=1 Tax=Chryseobacterium sp. G0162 TaxID=2487063 RepID=UPI000F4E684C|nr:hypothetical protein [Chryseobacterium sp. G0162]AZB07472.1 hypothetical protein EG344_00755 [Chryseobacterium sp. G0162]
MTTNNANRQPTMNAIGYNEWGYDNLIHRFFVTWCEVMADKFFYKDRDLINSAALFNYYKTQWSILVENKFVREYGGYISNNIPDSQKIYHGIICEYGNELENYYPASILKDTKQNRDLQFHLN